MNLSFSILPHLNPVDDLALPNPEQLCYPEKVLQFGTGVLLRGLPDQIIDNANRKGIFCGRIAVVKSTLKGSIVSFDKQDCLYTACFKGIEDGEKINRSVLNSAISRVFTAGQQWREILSLAENPDLELVISNTTEVGIALSSDSIHQSEPPSSFPGKLLAILFHRYSFFKGNADKGLVIVPTELIDNNGVVLKDIVLRLCEQNKLSADFIQWLNDANYFCNSLVDRIVPGKMSEILQQECEQKFGYKDELMIMAEPYGLWAIESTSPVVAEKLSFAKIDQTCFLVPSIKKYKEIKLRLLNGTHTFSCGVAMLLGVTYVRDAMSDPILSSFIKNLLLQEMLPLTVDDEITIQEAQTFANRVLDRFSNPFIEHKWESISMQFSSKMCRRNLPLIVKSIEKNGVLSKGMSTGLAAFIVCMNLRADSNNYWFTGEGSSFTFTDIFASRFLDHWKRATVHEVVLAVLSDVEIWGRSFPEIDQLTVDLTFKINQILRKGIRSIL